MNPPSKAVLQHIILPGVPEIKIIMRRSLRARRMSLRISRLKGEVILSLPVSCPISQARSFLFEKEKWVRSHLENLPEVTSVQIGSQILFQGKRIALKVGSGRQVKRIGDALMVPGPNRMVAPRTKAFFKLQARQALIEATDKYAAAVGQDYKSLTVRDTTSRWGSCSNIGNINYSWRLIMAPQAVLEYVAAHEVAHLVEMNHSDRFWAVVGRLYPNYDVQRIWLRQNGGKLHLIKF